MDEEKRESNYTDDESVDGDFKMPTCAAMVMYSKDPRLDGVWFILRGRKTFNRGKAEIPEEFKGQPGTDMPF